MTLDGLHMSTVRIPLNLLLSPMPLYGALGLPNRDCLHRIQLPFYPGTERT
jgi:hypothetical protein